VNDFYVVVAFENEKQLEFYHLKTSEVKYTLKFDKIIKKIECNTHKSAINEFQKFNCSNIHLVVIFEDYSMEFISINSQKKERFNLDLKKIRTIATSGNEIVAFKFYQEDYRNFNYDFFICSFDDGSLMYGETFENDTVVISPKLRDTSSLKLVPTDIQKNRFLFIDRDTRYSFLAVWDPKSQNENHILFSEISEGCDNAVFVRENKIVTVALGTITFYLIKTPEANKSNKDSLEDENKQNLYRIGQIDAHYNEIVFMFAKGMNHS